PYFHPIGEQPPALQYVTVSGFRATRSAITPCLKFRVRFRYAVSCLCVTTASSRGQCNITTDAESVKAVRNFVGARSSRVPSRGYLSPPPLVLESSASATEEGQRDESKLYLELIDGEQLLEMLYTTNAPKPALPPPQLKHDQEWRDVHGPGHSRIRLLPIT
ncbi:hypothetical protein NKH49_31140, partial [Mesorhizobium sp. M1088]|uniref:hypothetical protein n=1 Tax=Mesorhizobium sp. M1088 TaxID=2957056 RepID=UPI00333C6C45